MSDILERLRKWMPDNLAHARTMRVEAADEIERLRAALEAIRRGSIAVLVAATVDDSPINPKVLEKIAEGAGKALDAALAQSCHETGND